jgi:hypothetical protein
LSPAQQDKFSNFSGVRLARSKMSKPASAGISIRNYPHRIEMPFTPAAHGGVLKRHNKRKFNAKHAVNDNKAPQRKGSQY